MAVAGFYRNLDVLKTLLGTTIFSNQNITLAQMASIDITNCCPVGCSQVCNEEIVNQSVFANNLINSGVPDSTTFKRLISSPIFFNLINNSIDSVNNYNNNDNEDKNLFISDVNAINSDDYRYTTSNLEEKVEYYKFTNTFTSGLVSGDGQPLNDIDNLTSGHLFPLFKMDINTVNNISRINLGLSIWSVKLGEAFVPGVYSLKLYKEIGGTITEVGNIKTMDLSGTTIPPGNNRYYTYNFEIPINVVESLFKSTTFNATLTNGITDWSTFIETVSVNSSENFNYYIALVTDTVSTSGSAFIGINVTNIVNSVGVDCEVTCNEKDERYLGLGCNPCKATPNDSPFWTT